MSESSNPMDSLMEIFLVETNGFLSKLEEILLHNEKSEGGVREATAEIFRIMHTIKSSSAMMSMESISKLAHKVEDLFFFLRENPHAQVDDSKLTDIVLDAVDFIKRSLDGGAVQSADEQITYVDAFLKDLTEANTKAQPESEMAQNGDAAAAERINKAITVRIKHDCQMPGIRALEVIKKMKAVCKTISTLPVDPSLEEARLLSRGMLLLVECDLPDKEIEQLLIKLPFVESVVFAPAVPSPLPGFALNHEPANHDDPVHQYVERRKDSPGFGKTFANVEVTKLDDLVDLVGEILILQMELAQSIEKKDHQKSEHAVNKLKKLILTLQEATLSTRMIPLRETFLKMNRIVRDMCRKQNKEIEFIVSGEDTEVDRSIVENIGSPLMHIIRNSIDHGIEDETTRLMLDKPAVGRVELSAATEGRNVVITIVDDGAGFHTERIRQKAIESGFITESQAFGMSNEELNSLVFMPGFSTNSEITEYSGRGVGMDVVSDSLRQMNGKVIVQSEPGKGTRIVMKIPLTLAIIDTIILRVGEETCALPISAVRKILYMDNGVPVREVNGEDVVLLDGECYRILNLFDFYSYAARIPYEDGIMIVVNSDVQKYVVFANEILDRQDVVVKPAPVLFKTIRGISGCTILGDGRISLILDTDELLA